MRAYPITQVVIDHVAQTVVCEFCDTTHALAGEKLGRFGFIVQACRLARRHMGCSTRSRATIARELAAIMEGDVEQKSDFLARGRSNVLMMDDLRRPPSTITLDARGTQWAEPSAAHPGGLTRLAEPVLCIHCREAMTKSSHSICTPCQQRYGIASCMNRIREREQVEVAGTMSPEDEKDVTLCLHCGRPNPIWIQGICSNCSKTYGLTACQVRIHKRDQARAAAGAGSVS